MKIACIGNMNNNFSVLAKYLKHRGYDADLLLFSHEQGHFLPENDSFEDIDDAHTIQLNWGDRFEFTKVSKVEIKESLQRYQFIICCGVAPAFLHKAGLVADIFIPYGGDILFYPFYKFTRNLKNLVSQNLFAYHMKKGIESTPYVFSRKNNRRFESKVEKLKLQGERLLLSPPMVYTPEFNPETITKVRMKSNKAAFFQKIRDEHDLVIFHNSRHLWKTNLKKRYSKGNDKLLRAMANLKKQRPDKKIALITFNYGLDANNSKELINELGISDSVYWLEKQPRKELYVGISLSDVVVGELNYSFYVYGVVMESMAMAKPIFHYRDDSRYDNLYPMVSVFTEQEILNALIDLVDYPKKFEKIGRESYIWFEENLIKKPLDKIEEIISLKN